MDKKLEINVIMHRSRAWYLIIISRGPRYQHKRLPHPTRHWTWIQDSTTNVRFCTTASL